MGFNLGFKGLIIPSYKYVTKFGLVFTTLLQYLFSIIHCIIKRAVNLKQQCGFSAQPLLQWKCNNMFRVCCWGTYPCRL